MATVAISDSNNRVEDMETSPTVADIGSGAGGGQEAVTFYQGANSISRKITSTALRGTGTSVTAVNMTTGDDQVWLSKTFLSDYLDVNSVGFLVRLGSSASATYDYILFDDGTLGDRDVAPRGGWIIEAVDPNVSAWRDATNGSPSLTAVTHYQCGAGLANGVAKAVNIFIDSVDLGDGLYLVGGDSTDPDGTWDDFVADDEGTQTAGRFGHFATNASGIEVRGKAIRGRTSSATVTATVFTDSLQNVSWPGGRVAAGWNELEDDLGNASTVITETNTTFSGGGRDDLKHWFDSASEVTGGATDTITITGHGFATGDAVLYSDEGGTQVSGLTDATEYFVRSVDANTVALYSTRPTAYADTSRISLTAAGTGEQHSLRRQPDTRPDYNATGTSGSATYSGCNFIRFRQINPTSAVTFDGCTMVECRSLDLDDGATLQDCTVTAPTLAEGEAFVAAPDPEDADGTTFTSGDDGHAMRLTTTTGSPFTLTNQTFTGYWAHGNSRKGDGATFLTSASGIDASGEVITTNDTHGFSTGDAAYYNDNGGAASVGLTDGGRYYVQALTTTTLSLHVTKYDADNNLNRVNLSTSGTETHALYSSNAAIVNDSGGAITLNISGGTLPTVRNVGASTTNVLQTVTVQVHVEDTDGTNVQGAKVYVQKSTPTKYTAGAGNTAGDGDLVVTQTIDGDTPQAGTVTVLDRSIGGALGLQSYRYVSHDNANTFTFPTTVSFACTGGGTATLLQDTVNDFTALDIKEGDTVRNTTDGSWAVVDQITDANNITTSALQGGSDNTWTSGDTYSFHDLATTLVSGTDTVDVPILLDTTDASGDVSVSFPYAANRAVVVRVRYVDGATKYIPFTANSTITSSGMSVSATLTEDTVFT